MHDVDGEEDFHPNTNRCLHYMPYVTRENELYLLVGRYFRCGNRPGEEREKGGDLWRLSVIGNLLQWKRLNTVNGSVPFKADMSLACSEVGSLLSHFHSPL